MEANSLDILFEDVHLIVLCKPAGLLSQGEHTGDQNLVDLLRHHFGRNYVGLIHRLDRNTSGIMVVAKRSKSADRLSQSLQSGAMRRSYLGWLEGEMKEPTFQWENWLTRDEKTKTTRVSHSQLKDAKKALLSGKVLKKIVFKSSTISLANSISILGELIKFEHRLLQEGFLF